VTDTRKLAAAYLELTKPRILTLVLVTAAIGYILGAGGFKHGLLMVYTMIGVALTAGGSGALNHYLERDVDKRMPRTRNRPIPSGVIAAPTAKMFGMCLVLAGSLLLVWKVNVLTAFLAILTAFLYVLVYTPMKRYTWLNTLIGAIPGALPPMGGWAAATGRVEPGAWVLFAILFIWQMPHFYAIAWMFKEDYRKGGFKMLSVDDEDGSSTNRQILFFSIILVPASAMPMVLGIVGPMYLVGALLLGIIMIVPGIAFARSRSVEDARRVLKASVLYLPLLLLLIMADFGLNQVMVQ
jgi:heme o synthase